MSDETYYRRFSTAQESYGYYKISEDGVLFWDMREWCPTFYQDLCELKRLTKGWGGKLELISLDIFERDMMMRELVD